MEIDKASPGCDSKPAADPIPWEVAAVASVWARCSAVVAAELRAWAADVLAGAKSGGIK